MLDLVETVARNMKNWNEGALKTHTNCKKAWGLLTDDMFKANQHAMDGGSIMSKSLEVERKIKVQFEDMCVKTTKDDEEVNIIKGKWMVTKCDKKSK